MILKRLVLENFRNYKDLSWEPFNKINIIAGDNAQGKTNLLEAIYFITSGRSFRTSREGEMINKAARSFLVQALLMKDGTELDISFTMGDKSKSDFLVKGIRQKKRKLFQPGMSISFTPADLDLIRGAPAERRRWIDFEIGSFDLQYLYNLHNYNKVLAQKNNLLKTAVKQNNLIETIYPWNIQLGLYGSKIVHSRLVLLGRLSPIFKNIYRELTSGKEEIYFKYLSSIPLEDKPDPDKIKNSFMHTIAQKSGEEVMRRQSLVGPHRDDLYFFINGMDARHFGSRGQQRSIVLSLKMSLLKLYYEEYAEYPIMLLDDVLLELDHSRQSGLAKLFALPLQAFITSTAAPDHFPGDFKVYTVKNGRIKEGE